MRRPNGTGSVIKAKNGTYTAIVDCGYTLEGKRLRKWKRGFKTKKEAIKYLEVLRYEKPKATISALWETYEATDFNDLSSDKQRHYKSVCARLQPIWNTPIDKLSIMDLQRLIEPCSSFYQQKDIKTVLSHLYNIAIAQQMVNVNLTQSMRLMKHKEKEAETWSLQEIDTFWNAYENGNKFVGYILFMTYTGAMPAEVRNIRREMISYEKQEINGAGLKTDVRKNAPIMLPDKIIPVLKDLMTDSLVLWSKPKHTFYDEYEKCLKELGIEYKAPYTCRHTAATLLVNENSPLITQKLMRHARVTTTERYVHPSNETLLDAVNKI